MMRSKVSQSTASESAAAPSSRNRRNLDAQWAAHSAETGADAVRQTMDDAATSYASSASDAARRTMDTARSYASSASDAARETMDTARSYASSASEYAGKARRAVGEQSERVVGLAAGAALAAAFPPTDLEKQALGPVGDQMSKAAERVGEQLKQATMKAGERLKSAAGDRGLHTEGLKEVASEVADTFKATMRGQTDGPKQDVSSAERPAGTSDRSW